MTNSKFQTPDRIIREAERKFITSISRAQAYQLEKQGLFPKRIHLGSRSVGWRLSDIMDWMNKRTITTTES
ncbi:AlpA family phage regulatory protein [Photobacterium leiognathi]|uniref:AlpA family phage regulatory protein n=1 Tax=Photobacterium leiognathi TaxID=553611 RepID=UPI002981F89D|nr:AlpA family phage regulatory protein [Photobacterium leiognathi]